MPVTITTLGRYIRVLRPDGTQLSQHQTVEDAIESAINRGDGTYRITYPERTLKVFGTLNPLTGDTTPPTVPGNPTLVTKSASSVTFSWGASTDNVAVTGYQVLRGGVPITTTTQTSYTDSGLTPSTAYSYSVQAYDAAGNNSGTVGQSPLAVTTNANASPAWNVTLQALTLGDAYTLSLTSLCSDADTDPLTFSILSGTLPPGLAFNAALKTVSGTPSNIGTYVVAFRATDGIVNSDAAITFEVLNEDLTAPSVPTLSGSSPSTSQANLSWTASTDTAGTNERASGVASYLLYRDGLLRATIAAPTLTYSDTGLSAGVTYTYVIYAVDVAGNVSSGSASCAVTVQSAPSTTLRNASNTGIVGAGISEASLTTVSTSTTYNTAGQTITGRRFTATVTVNAANVTIRGCLFDMPPTATGSALINNGSNLLLEDCTFRCLTGSVFTQVSSQHGSVTVRRCDISHGENNMNIYGLSSVTIEYSYMHDPSDVSNPENGHKDCIEVYSCETFIARNSTLLNPPSETSVVNIAPWSSSMYVGSCLIENCYLDGGGSGTILRDCRQGGQYIHNLRVINNQFGGHTNDGSMYYQYANLHDYDSPGLCTTEAELAANPNRILWTGNTYLHTQNSPFSGYYNHTVNSDGLPVNTRWGNYGP